MFTGSWRPIPLKWLITLLLAPAWLQVLAGEDPKAHARPTIPPLDEIRQLPTDGGAKWNRLIFEKSPYLLQHAANPVDWYPWGEEAFAKAKKENKPVFLSIGYATCHWCHVMERESFEDEEVAALLNRDFVCVKVDREERPDVDEVYMTACRALTGGGGWPLTVVMTPEKKPFFAGTYFPKQGRHGRPGMMDLLPKIAEAWVTHHDRLLEDADKITNYLKEATRIEPGEAPTQALLDQGFQRLGAIYDQEHGGFGQAPKFPVPHRLTFLLRYWKRTGNPQALAMVEHTLQAMRQGGIYDQVGFGFHRYSTDPIWLAPHFEKMLYDQALLAMAYIETYQATGKAAYAQTAREIFDYVLREMTAPEGAFYSAEDADSEGEEGKFYLWTLAELKQHLGEQDAALFAKALNVSAAGNFKDEATQSLSGQNVLHLTSSLTELANTWKMETGDLGKRLEQARHKLKAIRDQRIHPIKDDKILTDWNGLMIAAMAKGARALGDPELTKAARRAADFVLAKLRNEDGLLLKRYRQGEAGLSAHLDDYAYFVWGLLELYETEFQIKYLRAAINLSDIMIRDFWDQEGSGFFLTAHSSESLILRSKVLYDGALPAGNSVAALNLLRLGRITAWDTYDQMAEKMFQAFGGVIQRDPSSFCQLLHAMDFAQGPSFEIVITGKPGAADAKTLVGEINRQFLPNKVVLFRPEGEAAAELAKIAPYTATQKSIDGKATVYVCQNFTCKKPTTDHAQMLANLRPEQIP